MLTCFGTKMKSHLGTKISSQSDYSIIHNTIRMKPHTEGLFLLEKTFFQPYDRTSLLITNFIPALPLRKKSARTGCMAI